MPLPVPRGKPEEYNRDTLYAEVWAEPVVIVAKRYGVSDVALAKACRTLGVPLPGRGYWTKRVAGQTPERPPLPPPDPDQRALLHIGRTVPQRNVSQREVDNVELERSDEQRITVPEELRSPHPLVAATMKAFRGEKPDRNGILCPDRSQQPLAISVSPALLNRALRIMDALIRALEARGYPVAVVSGEPQYGFPTRYSTQVRVGDDAFDVTLREKLRQIKRAVPPAGKKSARLSDLFFADRLRHEPSGELELFFPHHGYSSIRSRFADSPKRPLEKLLNEVIISLVRQGEHAIEARAAEKRRKADEQERLRLEAERQRVLEAERRRAQQDAARVTKLLLKVDQWQRAKHIREFVAAMRDAIARGGGELHPNGDNEHEFAWMLAQADAIDPVAKLYAAPVAEVRVLHERDAALVEDACLVHAPEDPNAR